MSTNYKLQTTNYSGGFTLVETMVAITILLISVVGPMSAIGRSLSQIGIARDQMIAINLAQEGVEVVRQRRDSNMLARWNESTPTTLWSAGIASGVNTYIIDSTATTPLILCTCTASQQIIRQDAVGLYHQYSAASTVTATKFSRVVSIADTVTDREKKVTSTVTWRTSGGINKSVTVSQSIFGINS